MGEPGGSSAAPRAEKGRRRHPRFSVPLSQQTADPPKAPSERWRWGRTAGLREAREGNDAPNPRGPARGERACIFARPFSRKRENPGLFCSNQGGWAHSCPLSHPWSPWSPHFPALDLKADCSPLPATLSCRSHSLCRGAARPGSVSGHRPRPERTEFTALMAQEGTSQQLRAWGCRAGSEAPRTLWGHSARMGCSRVSPVNLL